MQTDARLLIKVPLCVMVVSASYAATLALIERKFRLKPDHEWLEVAVGVGLTLVPVALEAHTIETESKEKDVEPVSWKTYEGAIWRSFLAAGAPIILWQIGEAVVRKLELMTYLTGEKKRGQTEQLVFTNGKRIAAGFSSRPLHQFFSDSMQD